MKKNITSSLKKFWLSFLFSFSTAFLTYLFYFQIANIISKRNILFSALIGFFAGGLFWLITKNKAEKNINKALLLQSFILAVFSFLSFAIPNVYFLAPSVDVEISIPSVQNGGQTVFVESINSDVQDIWFHQIPLLENTQIHEKSIALIPKNDDISSLTTKIRTWDRVYVDFAKNTPDVQIFIRANNRTEFYYPDINNPDDLYITSVEVNNFRIVQVLSDLLVFLSALVVLYGLLLSIYLNLAAIPKGKAVRTFIPFLFCLLVIIGFISITPPNISLETDSGVFMYIARGWLSGKIPYKNIWDHKGPVLYLLNVLGLMIGGGRWGVWLVELFSALVFTCTFYELMKKLSGKIGAAFGTIILLHLFFTFLDRGNFSEEFALTPSIISLLLFSSILQKPQDKKFKPVLIGMFSGINFMMRPNLISVYLAIGFILALQALLDRKILTALVSLLQIFLGWVMIVIPIGLYFLFHSALKDFVSAYFLFNFAYSGNTNLQEIILKAFAIVHDIPTYMKLAFSAWIFLMVVMLKNFKTNWKHPFWAVVLTGFIIELFLYNLSGRNYPHYNLSLIPYISILIVGSVNELLVILKKENFFDWKQTSVFLGVLIGLALISGGMATKMQIKRYYSEKEAEITRLEYISQLVSPDKKLIIWGSETATLFLLDMETPSRFVYQYAFTNCNYVNQEMVAEFISDIDQNKPVIIDAFAHYEQQYSFAAGKEYQICEKLVPIYQYIDENYVYLEEMENNWVVYLPMKK